MKATISVCAGLLIGIAASAALAAAKHPTAKGPPACSMLSFRAVPSGAADGEQQAGFYRSRFGTLGLHADVKGGQPTDYFVLADGKRVTAASAAPPDWAMNCAAQKKMPKPEGTAAASCTGERFRVVLAHQGEARLALLYGSDGSSWHYCSTGSY